MVEEDNQAVKTTVDTGSMIEVFKGVTENILVRRILKGISKYCKFDKDNRLDVALQIYTGQRDKACPWCKIAAKILTPILKLGGSSFGVTAQDLKERFSDIYWRRGLANVIKGIAQFGVQKPFVPGAPFQVVWNVTRRCNLKCKHCYENAGVADPDELTTEQAIKVIDKLADAGVIILAFSGGEPTIRKDILKLIRHAHRRGMYVACATNALTFADRDVVKKFKNAGLEFAQISLDGLDPKTHDEFRGVNGAWKRACEAIKNFSKTEVFVEVATTVTKNNYREILGMVDLVEKLGADWLMLYNFVPVGRGSKNVDMDISPKDRYRLLEKIYALNYEREIEILSTAPQFASVATKKSGEIIPTHFYNPKYESNEIRQLADFIGGCGAGRFYLSLEPNGDIYPCVFFPHDEHVKLGNILEDDFREIWEKNEVLWKLRNRNLLKGHCKTCVNRDICGGCRARAYAYFSDVCAPDPGCIHNEKWMEIKNERRYINKSSRHHRHKRKIKI